MIRSARMVPISVMDSAKFVQISVIYPVKFVPDQRDGFSKIHADQGDEFGFYSRRRTCKCQEETGETKSASRRNRLLALTAIESDDGRRSKRDRDKTRGGEKVAWRRSMAWTKVMKPKEQEDEKNLMNVRNSGTERLCANTILASQVSRRRRNTR